MSPLQSTCHLLSVGSYHIQIRKSSVQVFHQSCLHWISNIQMLCNLINIAPDLPALGNHLIQIFTVKDGPDRNFDLCRRDRLSDKIRLRHLSQLLTLGLESRPAFLVHTDSNDMAADFRIIGDFFLHGKRLLSAIEYMRSNTDNDIFSLTLLI